jgi:hypothetical protein
MALSICLWSTCTAIPLPPVGVGLAEDLTHLMHPDLMPTLRSIMGSDMETFFPNLEREMAESSWYTKQQSNTNGELVEYLPSTPEGSRSQEIGRLASPFLLDSQWLNSIKSRMAYARSDATKYPTLSQIQTAVKSLSRKEAQGRLKKLLNEATYYQGAGYRRMFDDLGVTWEMVQLMGGLDNIIPTEVQHATIDGNLGSDGYDYVSDFIKRTIKYHFGTTNQDSLLRILYPEKKGVAAKALHEFRKAAM